jgi:hypothetical protein
MANEGKCPYLSVLGEKEICEIGNNYISKPSLRCQICPVPTLAAKASCFEVLVALCRKIAKEYNSSDYEYDGQGISNTILYILKESGCE